MSDDFRNTIRYLIDIETQLRKLGLIELANRVIDAILIVMEAELKLREGMG